MTLLRFYGVRAVTRYRAVVDIGGITVSIPAKEVSYYWVDDVRDSLSIEDTLDVNVLEVDRENRKIGVSTPKGVSRGEGQRDVRGIPAAMASDISFCQ